MPMSMFMSNPSMVEVSMKSGGSPAENYEGVLNVLLAFRYARGVGACAQHPDYGVDYSRLHFGT